MKTADVAIGFAYLYVDENGATVRGIIWSPGASVGSWWVKPDSDPDHPVLVRSSKIVQHS